MAVISITITESTEQVVAGIPKSVTLSANISSTIFYTFDGNDPDLDSDIYVSTLKLPTDSPTLVFKVFATNGTDSSPVITTTYQTNESAKNVRFSHSGTDAQAHSVPLNDPRPFGTPPYQPNSHFTGAAEAGFNVNDESLPSTPNAFDADGNPTAYANEVLIGIATPTMPLILSETDAIGQRGHGIGNLPPKSRVQAPVPPPEQSNFSDKLYDPKALVIFQDYTNPDTLLEPVDVNRASFTLENVEQTRQGNQFFNVGPDTPAPTGNFVRQHYNPRDNTIMYYYFDSSVNRWIISKTAYTPARNAHNYAQLVFGREKGAGFVFEWRQFAQRYLY